MAEERMSGRSDTFGQTSEFDYIGFDEAPIVDPPPQYSESESSTEQTLERAQDPETPPDYGAPPTRSTRVINGMPVQPSYLTGEILSVASPSGNTTSAVSETEITTHTCPTCNGSERMITIDQAQVGVVETLGAAESTAHVLVVSEDSPPVFTQTAIIILLPMASRLMMLAKAHNG
ncbi:hypothetical protein HF325_004639 [Metschnikowia pulcherrima]|uniref:Uncharacterized protein n=1 Tax=Metschnikowia pulcherrima TaxID=27326 RepID=A0A8H7GPN8_9ASCO|nr:hypothetical protein HF325_004639 [Metschnikowia pulcherrima]